MVVSCIFKPNYLAICAMMYYAIKLVIWIHGHSRPCNSTPEVLYTGKTNSPIYYPFWFESILVLECEISCGMFHMPDMYYMILHQQNITNPVVRNTGLTTIYIPHQCSPFDLVIVDP